jgi:predicted negative regulator of RcsB-dependent stress response
LGRHYSNAEMKRAVKRDVVAETGQKALHTVKNNLEAVIVVAVVLVLAMVIVPYWWHSRIERQGKASMVLAEAQRMLAAGDDGPAGAEKYTQALSRFNEVVQGYGGTGAAAIAQLGAATCNLRAKKIADAETGFKGFLAKHAKHEMAPQAAAGLGYCLESAGKPKEAAAAFLKAANDYPQAFNLATLYLDAARNFGLSGDMKAKAEALKKITGAKEGAFPKEVLEKAKALAAETGAKA